MEVLNGKINSTNSYKDFKLQKNWIEKNVKHADDSTFALKNTYSLKKTNDMLDHFGNAPGIENRMYTIKKKEEDFMLKEEDFIRISIFK